MNQEKLYRYVLPGEKVIKRPIEFPSLPVQSEEELNALETFLSNDVNLSAVVSFSLWVFHYVFCQKVMTMFQRNYVIVLYFFLQSMYLGKFVDKNSLDSVQSGKYYEMLYVMMWQTNTAFKEPREKKSLKTWELILGE